MYKAVPNTKFDAAATDPVTVSDVNADLPLQIAVRAAKGWERFMDDEFNLVVPAAALRQKQL